MRAWATVPRTPGAKSAETVPPLWMVPPDGVAASLLLARSESPLSRPPTSKREARQVQIDGLGILATCSESLGETQKRKFARAGIRQSGLSARSLPRADRGRVWWASPAADGEANWTEHHLSDFSIRQPRSADGPAGRSRGLARRRRFLYASIA